MLVPEGFPEFIPFTSCVSARRHHVDESPALTAVLQAHAKAIVAALRRGLRLQRPRPVSNATLHKNPLAIGARPVSMAL